MSRSSNWERPIEDLHQTATRRIHAFERQIITESDLNYGLFFEFVQALRDDPKCTTQVVTEFELLPDSVQSHFEYMLRRLPCEGNYWDWPPGGRVLADPGGQVAWQTPIAEVQNAIATLRQCVIDYWASRGQTRNVAPGGPVEHPRRKTGTKTLRQLLVLWTKGIFYKPEDILCMVLDHFDETQFAEDWSACEECDRQRIQKLLESYRPSDIPWAYLGPPDFAHWDALERKYLMLLRILGLEPSPEWNEAHRTEQ